jgi:hypothetical protein
MTPVPATCVSNVHLRLRRDIDGTRPDKSGSGHESPRTVEHYVEHQRSRGWGRALERHATAHCGSLSCGRDQTLDVVAEKSHSHTPYSVV